MTQTKPSQKPTTTKPTRPHNQAKPSQKPAPKPNPVDNKIKQKADDLEAEAASKIHEINQSYFHVVMAGKNRIVRMVKSVVGSSLECEFLQINEFKQAFSHDCKILSYYSGREPVLRNPASVWLESDEANFLRDSVDFDPDEACFSITKKNKLNIYHGFGVKCRDVLSEDIQLDLYLNHLKEVICDNCDDHYKYLLGYIAHAVQKPSQKPSVSVIMKAGQGAGKGTAMDPLLTIFGAHSLAATSSSDITGKFNSALEGKILVFFDEAFSGLKEANDAMKGKVSGNYTRIERKGINSVVISNYMRIFMASNHENIINIESDDRTCFCLRSSEKYKQNKEYFKKMEFCRPKNQYHNYFCSRLLTFLKNVNISNFDPYRTPITNELVRQKIDYLEPAMKWIHAVLDRGCITSEGGWPNYIENNECYETCKKWLTENDYKLGWGSYQKKIGAAMSSVGMLSQTKRLPCRECRRVRVMPSLEECRKKFESIVGGTVFTID